MATTWNMLGTIFAGALAPAFAEAVQRIDNHLREEIERLETSRKQIAQLAAGDSLALPLEVISYLDRLREMGALERMVESERDGWILVAARCVICAGHASRATKQTPRNA